MENKNKVLFVGVDPHKNFHVMSLMDPFMQELDSMKFENSFQGFQKALSKINQLSNSHQLTPIVGMENTGGTGKFFSEFLVNNSIAVNVVSPVITAKLAQANPQPEKSDLTDAREVALASLVKSGRLPHFTVSKNRQSANDLNLLVKERDALVANQTKFKQRLHEILSQTWTNEYKTIIAKDVFCQKALRFFTEYPSAGDYHKDNHNYPQVSEICKDSIRRQINNLKAVYEDLKIIEKSMKALVDKICPYLLSLNGCAFRTAAKIFAEVNDIDRFDNSSKLAKYSGLAPIKYESGQKKNDKRSKRGNIRLKFAMKTIALTQIGKNGNQLAKEYYRKKLKGNAEKGIKPKNEKQAVRCLMRQLIKIVFKMLKEQRPYYH